MRKNLGIFLTGGVLFVFFVFFSFLVHKDLFTQLDFNTTVILQDHLPRRVDKIFSMFSEIGKFEVMVVLLIVILFVLRRVVAGFLTLGFFAGLHLFELFGKFYVDHPPPPHFMLRTQSIVDFPQFYVRSDNSYPSGHSGRTMFISAILFFFIWRSKKLNLYWKIILSLCVGGFDLIMFVSRIYLGEHWTTDVVGGALLGASLGLVGVYLLMSLKLRNFRKKGV